MSLGFQKEGNKKSIELKKTFEEMMAENLLISANA